MDYMDFVKKITHAAIENRYEIIYNVMRRFYKRKY